MSKCTCNCLFVRFWGIFFSYLNSHFTLRIRRIFVEEIEKNCIVNFYLNDFIISSSSDRITHKSLFCGVRVRHTHRKRERNKNIKFTNFHFQSNIQNRRMFVFRLSIFTINIYILRSHDFYEKFTVFNMIPDNGNIFIFFGVLKLGFSYVKRSV